MDERAVRSWIDAYFAAWISNDPDDVAALFTEHAIYAVSPFADPWVGRDEIVRRWTSGGQEDVEHAWELLSLDGEIAIAHWNVTARIEGESIRREWDGILLLRFAADGRCAEHREWYAIRDLTA